MRKLISFVLCLFFLGNFSFASRMLFDNGKMKIHAGTGKINILPFLETGRKMQGVTGKTWGIQRIKSAVLNMSGQAPEAWGVYRELPKRPPVIFRDFVAQGLGGVTGFFVGIFAGATIGGVVDGTFSPISRPGQFFNGGDESGILLGVLGGALIGPGVGVWLGGRTRTIKGNLGLTILGSFVGGIVGISVGVISYGLLSPLIVAGPVAGAMFMYNIKRKWAAAPEGASTSSLRMPGGPVAAFTILDLRF